MDRQAYSKAYNEYKQLMREAIRDGTKRFAEANPERFAELQERAKHELEHPPERPIIRYTIRPLTHFDADEFIRRTHTKDYYLYTTDCWGSNHLYFESLDNETPEEVLQRRHPKFAERQEKVTKVEPCQCPLCS